MKSKRRMKKIKRVLSSTPVYEMWSGVAGKEEEEDEEDQDSALVFQLLVVKLRDLDDRRRDAERRPAPTCRRSHRLDLTPATHMLWGSFFRLGQHCQCRQACPDQPLQRMIPRPHLHCFHCPELTNQTETQDSHTHH